MHIFIEAKEAGVNLVITRTVVEDGEPKMERTTRMYFSELESVVTISNTKGIESSLNLHITPTEIEEFPL